MTQALQGVLPGFNPAAGTIARNHRRHGMDLTQTRYLDFRAVASLLPRRQCRRPAGGRDLRLHRPPDAEVRPRPGQPAFQLTNIIRDVGGDARRGRIYLPIDELQQFDVRAADILNARYSTISGA